MRDGILIGFGGEGSRKERGSLGTLGGEMRATEHKILYKEMSLFISSHCEGSG